MSSKISTNFGSPSGDSIISVGSETWNIADGYTKIKILRLLIELDLYETIAEFGFKDLEENMGLDNNQISMRRIEGLHRVMFNLKQLIGNCKFSLKKKNHQMILSSLLERLENVEQVIEGTHIHNFNDVTKEEEIKVNEQHFRTCFNVLRDIKDELNFPINEAGLIFRQNDEVDLDKMMNDIIHGG